MGKLQLRLSSPPLALQILALLLGGLVIAQAVTLFLTLVLPPEPEPQYGLDTIARALTGGSLGDNRLDRPLQRLVEQAPPSPNGPGWLTSEQSRHMLASLLGRNEEDVQLYFFTPLPFAGVAGPARPQSPISAAGRREAFNDLPPLPPRLLYADYQVIEIAPTAGGVPGASFPAGGLPNAAPAAPSISGSIVPPLGSYPASTLPSVSGTPAVSPGIPTPVLPNSVGVPSASSTANPGMPAVGGTIAPAVTGTAVVPQLAAPSLGVILPPDMANGIFAPQSSVPPDPGPLPPKRPPVVSQPEPIPQTAQKPSATLAERKPAERSKAALAPPPLPSPPVRRLAPPGPIPSSPLQSTPARPRGLFGLAPAPFVEGYFIAALRLADGRWAVVQPVPEPFPNGWQRRVLLWFAISFALVAPLGWLFARHLVRPITGFAAAAEQLGRDPTAPIMPLEGPAEVGRAARAFNRMQNRLRSFVDDRTAMVGAISHDLRTPLTRLRFRIENVPDDLRDGMLAEVEEMEQMINSVLAFIRDASEPGSREMLDLRTLVEDVVEDAVFVGKQVTLEESGPAEVEVDPLSMRRLLGNLVENAVKYGDSARVRLFTDKQDAVAEIHDDGPGLPEDELEKVFQPFYRSPQARTSNKHGTGLGLAVCRSIARAHGGDVQLMKGERGLIAQLRVPLAFGVS